MNLIVIGLMLISISIAELVDENQEEDDDLTSTSPRVSIRQSKKAPTRIIDNNCTCIPYFNCLTNGHINEYGVSIIKPRKLPIVDSDTDANSEVRYCPKFTDVCCVIGNGSNLVKLPPIKSPKPTIPKVGCGYRNFNGVSGKFTRTNNNQLTNEGEFPWMVYIYRKEIIHKKSYSAFKCAGTLINENVVLTSAQCIYKIKNLHVPDLRVRVGEWKIGSKEEIFPTHDVEVDWIYTHPQFVPTHLNYDFALIILRNPVTFAENIQNVCLPRSNEEIDSKQCYITGWATKNSGNANEFSSILKAIPVPIISSNECQARYQKTRLGRNFRLHPSLMCAGGVPGHNTCESDMGSPLVCPLKDNPERYVQTGVIAWSLGCNNKNPAIFANVSAAQPWINETLETNSRILPIL